MALICSSCRDGVHECEGTFTGETAMVKCQCDCITALRSQAVVFVDFGHDLPQTIGLVHADGSIETATNYPDGTSVIKRTRPGVVPVQEEDQ